MDLTQVVDYFNAAWDLDGFLHRLRSGEFDETKAAEFEAVLSSIHVENADLLPRDLVRLVWFIPLFATWQTERVVERGTTLTAISSFISRVTTQVERILGMP